MTVRLFLDRRRLATAYLSIVAGGRTVIQGTFTVTRTLEDQRGVRPTLVELRDFIGLLVAEGFPSKATVNVRTALGETTVELEWDEGYRVGT